MNSKTRYAIRLKGTGKFFRFNQTHDDGYGQYVADVCLDHNVPSFFTSITEFSNFHTQFVSNSWPETYYTEDDLEWVEFTLTWD